MIVDVVAIREGEYLVGDDHVPNAFPRHMRRLRRPIWMDASPVTWRLFQTFVAVGGYANPEWWRFGPKRLFLKSVVTQIDRRCCELAEQVSQLSMGEDSGRWDIADRPIVGLTWFEAAALARACGARLPLEVEWEISQMPASGDDAQSHDASESSSRVRSHWGAEVWLGQFQEWTSAVFSPRYWSADLADPGELYSPDSSEAQVSVRGTAPTDVHQHLSYRRGADPWSGTSYRTFRRVWDQAPAVDQISAVRAGAA